MPSANTVIQYAAIFSGAGIGGILVIIGLIFVFRRKLHSPKKYEIFSTHNVDNDRFPFQIKSVLKKPSQLFPENEAIKTLHSKERLGDSNVELVAELESSRMQLSTCNTFNSGWDGWASLPQEQYVSKNCSSSESKPKSWISTFNTYANGWDGWDVGSSLEEEKHTKEPHSDSSSYLKSKTSLAQISTFNSG